MPPKAAPRRSSRATSAVLASLSDEKRFARQWLMSHETVSMDEEDIKRVEWEACMAAGDCAVIDGNELSESLNTAWQEEEAALEKSRIEAEYLREEAEAKQAAKEETLAERRRESDKWKSALSQFGLVAVKEKKKGLAALEGDLDESDDDSEVKTELESSLGSPGKVAEAEKKLEELGVKVVTRKKAKDLHGAGSKPLKPLAVVKRKQLNAAKIGKKRVLPDKESDGTESEEEQKTSKPKSKEPKTTQVPSLSASDLNEINVLYAQTLAAIAKARKDNPIEDTATFQAIQEACTQEVLHPREKGFAGSALAPPLPLFYKKFLDDPATWK